MKFNLHLACLLFVSMFTSANINAADFADVTLNPKVSSGTLSLDGANGAVVVNFAGNSIVDKVLFTKAANGATNVLASQNPVDVQKEVEQQFKITGTVLMGEGDISGNSSIFSSTKPFNCLAIHFGKHELFFKFAMPTTSFNISVKGKAAGLSNYRVFYVQSNDNVIILD